MVSKLISMKNAFRPCQPNQQFLLPPSLEDWLPDDRQVHFIDGVVDRLDLSATYYDYRERRGQPPDNPYDKRNPPPSQEREDTLRGCGTQVSILAARQRFQGREIIDAEPCHESAYLTCRYAGADLLYLAVDVRILHKQLPTCALG